MNSRVRIEIESQVKGLDKKEYPKICELSVNSVGLTKVVNMINNRLNSFKSWTFGNCIADVEMQLNK